MMYMWEGERHGSVKHRSMTLFFTTKGTEDTKKFFV